MSALQQLAGAGGIAALIVAVAVGPTPAAADDAAEDLAQASGPGS